MELSEIGFIARSFWLEIPDHFPNVVLDEFVIMPDHFHGILEIVDPIPVVGPRPIVGPRHAVAPQSATG